MPEAAMGGERGIEPLRPEEVAERHCIPDEVIEVFNEMIVEGYSGTSAHIIQDDVVKRLTDRGMDVHDIFTKRWLDVEETYRQAGWDVEYDKPAYNESYRAFFIFRRPRSREIY
jgi:hypothetical protein